MRRIFERMENGYFFNYLLNTRTSAPSPLNWVLIFPLHRGKNRNSERSSDLLKGKKKNNRPQDLNQGPIPQNMFFPPTTTWGRTAGRDSQMKKWGLNHSGKMTQNLTLAKFGHNLTLASKEKPELRLHICSPKIF